MGFSHFSGAISLKIGKKNYENNNEEATGTLLVSVSGINFKNVYILLADKAAGYAEYL